MLEIDIPGFGPVRLEYLVSDYTGTLSADGRLMPGVQERLNRISEFLKIYVLTADTFGLATSELKDIICEVHILYGNGIDIQKETFLTKLGSHRVVAIGNGNNDRLMLKAAKIGIAVTELEGCSVEALKNANIHVKSALNGLDLLLNPTRLKATLRF